MVGCSLTNKTAPTPLSTTPSSTTSPPIGETPAPVVVSGVTDTSWVLDGTCFEALLSLDGQRLVIEDEVSLNLFYDLLDGYCEEPMPRPTFDFSTQLMVVVVEIAQACQAEFMPLGFDNQQLMLQFVQSGTCAYDVVAIYMGTLAAESLQVSVSGA